MKPENNYSLEKIIDKTSIDKRVYDLSEEISSYFSIDDDFVAICVLNGSLFFYVDFF